jgi:hypothetical protein
MLEPVVQRAGEPGVLVEAEGQDARVRARGAG